MTVYVALLRAVNVGGTGKLVMSELRDLCEAESFEAVRTYIQTGNIVFRSALDPAKVKAKLEKAVAAKLGKPCGVLLRTGTEMAAVAKRNPFPQAAPNRIVVVFLDQAPARGALASLKIPGREEVKLQGRDLFIHFPDGQGTSKLKIPFANAGTGRNLNTVAKLAAMAQESADDQPD